MIIRFGTFVLSLTLLLSGVAVLGQDVAARPKFDALVPIEKANPDGVKGSWERLDH